MSRLGGEGWQVLVIARRAADLGDLAAHVFEAGVSDPGTVERAAAAVGQQGDLVDLWIYAAGDIDASKVVDSPPTDWQRILDANLLGAYLAAHDSLPLLARDAHLVFWGALSERLRLPRLSAYAAAKAGLEAFVEVLSKEERRRRVTLVRPALWTRPCGTRCSSSCRRGR